ncbi:MAG: indolepyruvate ferredoxin oxidoreductase family protein [Acidimicrobiia bacterium]
MVDAVRGYELVDRYRKDEGRVFLSGAQALARLPFEQLRADRQAGLDTAAFVSGYPGSPLAGYDRDVSAVAKLAERDQFRMVVRPAVNEELAATAVMGSQLATTLAGFRHDGVVGIWYGKAPGLDRASDAIRHAVFAGTARHGGVVALVGDDPAAKSSTLPSSSGATLVDLNIPVLFPGDVQEAVELGRHAVALSRASGLWTSIKIVAAVADGTGTVELETGRITPILPEVLVDGQVFVPRPSGKLLTPYTLDMEREFQEVRLEVARRYGVDNQLNRISVGSEDAWIGIVASGHTYHELLEALRLLGLDTPRRVADAGIRLLQLRMPIPLDAGLVRRFARGLSEVVVVEEKGPTLEWMVKDALYSEARRPVVVGKFDDRGQRLVPITGTLDPDVLAGPLRSRLLARLGEERLADPAHRAGSAVGERKLIPLAVNRTPFFCSGCPHNTSTKVPEGALVGGGIGCHAMVALMEPERVGDIVGLTAMGNEGAQWIGMAPFVDRNHLIQNIGDGTFFHSGHLAVRAAVASGVNITYKLLYNGAVAMTGGQDPQGAIGVPELAQMLQLEGCARVLITTEDVGRYDAVAVPDGVEVWDRSRVVEAQELLAAIPGVTVLIHDQACAAENRRGRKRGTIAIPAQRVVINERVCEGCGDCGVKSNCLSVQPIDTPFGRKTHIDQTSCNLDFSCLEGDCPSFATVVPKRRRKSAGAVPPQQTARRTPAPIDPASLPEPQLVVPADRCTIRLSGIGGTGVVTVSQVLGTAAMLDGLTVRGLDQTGLSQKAGPVVSDLRLTYGDPQPSNKATHGTVDLYLAFDLLVAASDTHLAGASEQCTVVVGSTTSVPTGSMVVHPERGHPSLDALLDRLESFSRPDVNRYVDASAVNDGLFGDGATTNMFLVGVAFQSGTLPFSAESVERAIELNGVAVERNVSAFRWGRRWAVDPPFVEGQAGLVDAPAAEARIDRVPAKLQSVVDEIGRTTGRPDVAALVARFAADLVGYQHAGYAAEYLRAVATVAGAEAGLVPGASELTSAVAANLYKLMAYKDEYEVARLLTTDEARRALEAVGGSGAKVKLLLHPPMLRSLGMDRKLRLGRSAGPMLGMLRRAKVLRGHWYDPFGRAEMRRVERAMIPEYRAAVDRLVAGLTPATHADAVAIASLPDRVRGYEHLKLQRALEYREALAAQLEAFDGAEGGRRRA